MGICVCICIYASIYAYIHHGAVRQGVLPERISYPSPLKCLGHPAWWSNKRPRHLGESRNRVPGLAPGLPPPSSFVFLFFSLLGKSHFWSFQASWCWNAKSAYGNYPENIMLIICPKTLHLIFCISNLCFLET